MITKIDQVKKCTYIIMMKDAVMLTSELFEIHTGNIKESLYKFLLLTHP